MKRNYFFLLFIFFLSSTSCSKDDDNSQEGGNDNNNVTDSDVKKWIREKMDIYYLWNDKLPQESSINGSLSVDDYFEQLIYRNNKNVPREDDTYGDRFSYIENLKGDISRNTQTAETDFGGKLTLIGFNNSKSVIAQFLYISPDSPLADIPKIKRGTIFNKVNGIQLTEDNYQELLFTKSSIKISNDSNAAGAAPLEATTITMSTYPANPILFSDILQINGHRVGYLVYNEFKRGPDENDFNNTLFEENLKVVFRNFKSQGVDKFVLDLRYNPGGYLVTAQLLASLLAKETALGKVLAYHKYNSKVEKSPALKHALGGDINYFLEKQDVPYNLNLQDLAIITTGRTASASEFVLNCLMPYMNVIQVGETTVGKNQSALAYKREPQNDWKISPIISYVENAERKGSYEKGITPAAQNICYEYNMISEGNQLLISNLALYPFGDINHEPMLRQALKALGLNVPSIRTSRSASYTRIPQSNIIKIQEKDKGLIRILQ